VTLTQIYAEIVKRADEDMGRTYYLDRAKEHFISAVYSLITATMTGGADGKSVVSRFGVNDYYGLVDNVKLGRGVNCLAQFSDRETKGYTALKILTLIDAYCTGDPPASVKILDNIDDFRRVQNNANMNEYNNIMYLCYFGGDLLTSNPFKEYCQLRYIKPYYEDHSQWTNPSNQFNNYSTAFINAALEVAVAGFSAECLV